MLHAQRIFVPTFFSHCLHRVPSFHHFSIARLRVSDIYLLETTRLEGDPGRDFVSLFVISLLFARSCFLFFFCTYPPSRNRRDYVSASQLVKTTRLQRTRREISHLSSSIFFCLSSSIFFFVPTHRPQFRACHASQGETFQVLHGEKLWASH